MTPEIIRAHAARAKAWLFDDALPLWWSRGFDGRLWHEALHLDGTPVADSPRRVRVQARQTAVYAFAGAMGWPGPWRDAVEAGVAVLVGPAHGPLHKLSPDGAVADARFDLYDAAFVLFALAHAARALQRDALIGACAALMDRIEQGALAQGGFDEGAVAPSPPRRQNPHMHLFEATLVLAQTTSDARWRNAADQLGALFRDRLFQLAAGVLPELFDSDWRPAAESPVEPGHHYEWTWLLSEWARSGGEELWDAQDALMAFAERHGVGPHGAPVDELDADGAVRTPTARLWPGTERIKAGLAWYERTRDTRGLAIAADACDALFRYLDTPVRGLWRDRQLPDGTFRDEPAPASSFYHIAMAFSELGRVAATL